jgi:uncharacterized protein (TIGR02001 family)
MLTSIRGILAATLATGFVLAATPALADETDPPSEFTITGNVAIVTDYRFRGNINHASGFYVGGWASSIDFSQFPSIDPVYGNLEVDVYGGWTGGLGGGITADVGLLYYVYPGGRVGKANFFEPYASLSTTMGPVTGKIGVAYAPKQASLDLNADGINDDNTYVYLDLSSGIPGTPISVAAHAGYTSGALSPKFATGLTPNYAGGWDYNIGATYNITKALSVGVQYIGVDGASLRDYSNDTAVFTVKYTF